MKSCVLYWHKSYPELSLCCLSDFFFFSSRRRHTRLQGDWSSDVCSSDLTASYAMLGDLNIAEPKALIGFAGPRVIEQTIRQTLPDGFQRSEFLVEHGMVEDRKSVV